MSYVISDLHLGHTRLLTGWKEKPLMRHFASLDAMHECIVERWNATIKEANTQVYVLGDITLHRRYLPILKELTGSKVLIRGNHDTFKLKDYLPYFEDIRGCHVYQKRFLLSHAPWHPGSMTRYDLNIHGHLHTQVVMNGEYRDRRYINVSVEQTNYYPVNLDQLVRSAIE